MQSTKQQQQQQSIMQDANISTHIISNVIAHIFTLSEEQIKLNRKVQANMNPYTSVKVSSLINQIGHLIYQQAEQSQPTAAQQKQNNKVSITRQVLQNDIFPKDNMFTTGASVFPNPNNTLIVDNNQKDDKISVNSFKTSFSKPRTKTISSTHNVYQQKNTQNLPQNMKRLTNKKSETQLINLRPSTRTGRSKSSAFDSSNNNQQKILELTIDQYRDQKIIQEEAKQKSMENKKKMTTLLSKDQMIQSFNYQGDIVKITKREFNIMMEKRSNVKMAESILVPGNHKFWKTKKTFKDKNNTTQNFNSTSPIENISKSKTATNKQARQNVFKKTTIDTINQMKKNWIEISNKKVIKPEFQEKIDFKQYKKNLQARVDSSLSYKSNKTLTQEQIKLRNNKMDFLTNNLSQYHQKLQNCMPQWIKTVQNGCKVTIFAAKNQIEQNLLHDKKNNQKNQALRQSKNKNVRSHSQPRQKIQHNLSLNDNFVGNQIKCLSNLKTPQRQQSDLMVEWEKRKLIKTVEVRQEENKNSKSLNKNILTSKKGKPLEPDNFELARSITDAHIKRPNWNEGSQFNENKVNISQRKLSQDVSNQLSQNYSTNFNQQTTINLNLQQFKIVKGYLQSKNLIFQKKQSISKYRTQSILDNRKTGIKKDSNDIRQTDSNLKTHNFKTIGDYINNNEEENIHDKNTDHQQKRNKIVSFSQFGQNLTLTGKKTTNQGNINVTNQRLKNSLIGSTSQIFISPSSILYTKKKTQNNENITEKNRGKSIEVFQLQKFSKSQKIFLPVQSQKKQDTNFVIKQRGHSNDHYKTLTSQQQKSTKKVLSIIQRKHHSTVLRVNSTPKATK